MMLLTEEEARTKWCPLARSYDTVDDRAVTANRHSSGAMDGACRCIGSACMAWRKESAGAFDKFGNLPGYCGAFGKVEQ